MNKVYLTGMRRYGIIEGGSARDIPVRRSCGIVCVCVCGGVSVEPASSVFFCGRPER